MDNQPFHKPMFMYKDSFLKPRRVGGKMFSLHNATAIPLLLFGNTTSADQPNFSAIALLNILTGTAIKEDMLFRDGNLTASNGSDQTYGLVQCTRDINSSGCRSCLSQLIRDAESCCQSRIGLRIIIPSCSIRYETYSFFQQPPVPPPSAPALLPPPQSSGKTFRFVIFFVV